jgi:hypothetical protein
MRNASASLYSSEKSEREREREWGARYLTGENGERDWAEFSTLS